LTAIARRTRRGCSPSREAGVPWFQPLLLRFFCGPLVRTAVSSWGVLRSTGRIDRPAAARTVRRGDRRRVQPIRSSWGPLPRERPPPPVASTRWASAQAECQKPAPTFADVLAVVRRHLCPHTPFCRLPSAGSERTISLRSGCTGPGFVLV
jgi:hypothetical protein